ncbi:MAG: phage tail tape measure protein [Magnetococcus sp. YQC-5]
MANPSLEFMLYMNTADFAQGMARVQREVATNLRGMSQAARDESQRIQSALNGIRMSEDSARRIDSIRVALAASTTEATRLGNAYRQSSAELSRMTGQIDKASADLATLRRIPAARRTDSQNAEITAIQQNIQNLRTQAGELRNFTSTLHQDYNRASTAVSRLNSSLAAESNALAQLRTGLQGAGVDTNRLAAEQQALQARMAQVAAQARTSQRLQDARNILGFRADTSVREIQRLEAAYRRLAASGSLSSADLARAHTTLQARIASVRGAVEQTTGTWASHFQMTTMGLATLAASLTGVTGALKGSFSAFSDFTFHMAEVYTLSDVAPAVFQKVSDEMRKMSVEMGRSASDSAKALYNVVSAGIPIEQGTDVVKLSIKAAVAGITDVKTAATLGVQIINSYGKNINELERVFDTLFKVIKIGVTTFPELANELGVVLPIAKSAGVAFDEVGSAMAVITKAGVRTPEAATALKAMIKDLAAPAPEAAQRMRELGISWNGFLPTLKQIAKLNLGTADIRKIIPEVRADTGVLILTDLLKTLISTLDEVHDGAKSLEVAYQKVAATPEEKIRHMKAALEELTIQMGSTLSEGVTPAVEGLTQFARSLSRAPVAVGILGGALGTFVAGSLVWNLGLKQMAAGLALGAGNAMNFSRAIIAMSAGSTFATLLTGIDAATVAVRRFGVAALAFAASPVGIALITAAGAYHLITKRAADHLLIENKKTAILTKQASQYEELVGYMDDVNKESAILGNTHVDKPIAEMMLAVQAGTMTFAEAQKQAASYRDQMKTTAAVTKNAIIALKAAQNDLVSSGAWDKMAEGTKRFAVAMVSPVEGAKDAFIKAIAVTENQLTKYNEILTQHKDKLKQAVDDVSKSYKSLADAASSKLTTNTQELDAQFEKRKETLRILADEFFATENKKSQFLESSEEREAQAQNFSQRSMLQAAKAVAIEEADAKLKEADRYFVKAMDLSKREFQTRIDNAKRLGLDGNRVDEERLQSQRSVLEKTEAAYRQNIDKLISEEKRHRDAAKQLAEQRKDFNTSIQDRLATLAEKGMDPVQVYAAKQTRIAKEKSQAEAALRSGNYESARKHADKMISLAESTSDAVSQGDKVVVGANDAAARSYKQIRDAAQIVNKAFEDEEESHTKAATDLQQAAESSTEKMNKLREILKEIDLLLAKDHKLILDADTKKIEEIGPKMDDLMSKIKQINETKIELQAGATDLGTVLSDALKGDVDKIAATSAKASGIFEKFKIEFAGWQPEIKATFDAQAATGAVNALTEKVNAFKATAKEVESHKTLIDVQTDQAMSAIDNLLVKMAEIQDKRVTIYTNYVEQRQEAHAAGGVVGFTRGGFLPGWGNKDDVAALLTRGEFVFNQHATKYYGVDKLNDMNQMRVPRFALGGQVQGFAQGGLVRFKMPSVPRLEVSRIAQNLRIPVIPRMAFAGGGEVSSPKVTEVVQLDLMSNGRPEASVHGDRESIRKFVNSVTELARASGRR